MKRLNAILSFFGFYLVEVLIANGRIALDILTPRDRTRPRIVTVALGPLSPFQLLVLTNLITMTPGTLCLDVSADGRELVLHALYAESDDDLNEMVNDYERRVRRAF